MSEFINSTPRRRLPYGSVPLEPWTAPHPDMPGESYYSASLNRIYQVLEDNMKSAIDKGVLIDSPNMDQIHKFCELSLTYAHTHRINHHYENGADKELEGPEEILQAAKDGTATPTEMLDILLFNPQLGAIEMAKLTHPFDGEGDREMMQAVEDAIEARGGILISDGSPRYKTKRGEANIPALVVLKKRLIGCMETSEGIIEVVERKTFLLRGDDAVAQTAPLHRFTDVVRQVAEYRKSHPKEGTDPDYGVHCAEEKLFDIVTSAHASDDDHQQWLEVLTTSVYARYKQS